MRNLLISATTMTALAFAGGCNAHDTTPHATEQAHMHGGTAHMHTVAPTDMDAEKDYLHRMSDHHQSAIAMAQLAQQKASHLELKAMAQTAIDTQTKEIAQMTVWSTQWYSHALEAHATDDMKPVMARLSSLSADAFDRAYLMEMTKHHRMGIEMATPMAQHAPHAETRKLSQAIVDEQSKEIDDMSSRLTQWYGVAPGVSAER